MRSTCRLGMLAAIFAAGAVWRTLAAAPDPEQAEFFESKVRPIFAENCYRCHSEKAEKLKGELRLDTPEALLKGGASGPAIVAGDPDASLLIKAVRHTNSRLQMPFKGKKLPAEQILILESWVKMGAPVPNAAGASGPLTVVARARASHWAFQP